MHTWAEVGFDEQLNITHDSAIQQSCSGQRGFYLAHETCWQVEGTIRVETGS
jgi:hypothetical protein